MAQPPHPPGASTGSGSASPALSRPPAQAGAYAGAQPRGQPASQSPAAPAQPAPAQQSAQQQQQASFRPLNVRDALHYLDRVKQQFATEYEVYDQFLTIMKDFKTQNIDTPGVIDRVSSLFRDHPSLIQGFNTFLPPGYRIECHVAPSAGAGGAGGGAGNTNTITVTTPMGITTRTQNVSSSTPLSAPSAAASAAPPAASTPASAAAKPAGAAALATGAASLPQNRLPPLPHVRATQPPRPISPPAPIPPFGGNRSAGGESWAQQQQRAKAAGGAGAPAYGAQQPQPQPQQSARSSATPQAGVTQKAPVHPAYGQGAQQQPQHQDVKPVVGAGEAQHGAHAPQPAQAQQQQQQQQPAAAGAAPAAVAGAPGQPPAQPQVMEFNHAINYVNKIKNRFAKEPETYKTFLEILQTYQKDQRPIQEVYTQVTALFKDAPDLLDEFKAFLPDTTGQDPNAQAGAAASAAAAKKPVAGKGPVGAMPGKGVSAAAVPPPQEKKKRAAPGTSEKAKAKRAKMAHMQGAESPPIGGPIAQQQAKQAAAAAAQQQQQAAAAAAAAEAAPVSPYGAPPPPAQLHHAHPYGAPPPGFPGAPRMQSAYDAYLAQHRNPPLVQPEEFGFFDRVKKHIDDRDAYTEFLKLLNLFTQEIIDLKTLLSKSLLFIGNDDNLVAQFKELVGWDPVKDGRVDGEDWIIDNEPVLERPRVELHLLKSFGPSYRKLPDSEIDLACSGRGPLEWSVLNDEWVAFATWASEGSGAHRKNPYEEALYNSEQERHWYSYHLESMARTIAHFEPIAARLALMSSDERAAFKLGGDDGSLGLGGTAPSVYERILRKIYGKDHGWEIIEALIDNPAVAVPIVLARLKQKDEEWKRAEREWNKVWREVDAKNFYRALDHQGIPFKALDKKMTTTSKSLTSEIETLRRDKQQKRYDIPDHRLATHPSQPIASVTYPTDAISTSLPKPLRPLHQFEMHMVDRTVLFDVLKLTFSYLDRDQSGYSIPERARVEAFLRLFVPLLWGVPHIEMEAALGQSQHDDLDAEEDDAETEAEATDAESAAGGESGADTSENGGSPGARKGGVGKRGGAADLRKRLLMHAAATAGRGGNGGAAAGVNGKAGSRAGSPSEDDELGRLMDATWITLTETKEDGSAVDPPSADEVLEPRRFSFFANSTFYCLVRVFHQIYHRLLAFKQLAADLAATESQSRRLNPLGVDLGLSQPVPTVDTGDSPAEHYYEHMLELAEKLFDGDIDQQTFEEQLRYMAGIRSYPLFTIDKLVSTVIKHIHTVNSDGRCQDVVALLEKDRARATTTPRQQIAYRMEVESVLGQDDNLYRMEWFPDAQALTIQLLGKEDLTLDDAHASEAKLHQSWLASFMLTSPSEGIGAQVKAPLLKRNRMLSAAEDPQDFTLSTSLEAKVSEDAYQLFFVAGTEDYLHRVRRRDSARDDDEGGGVAASRAEERETLAKRRRERFAQWVDDHVFPERRRQREAEEEQLQQEGQGQEQDGRSGEGLATEGGEREGEEEHREVRPTAAVVVATEVAGSAGAAAGRAEGEDVEMSDTV
ncbi:hypothetical protein Rhopal_000248-T1 [Rhodotorula paludigena]|uniref:Histone deacetylase interacting domain-containing protein n=1 Tax=Rhodotorula paludigena TaxID=86838 RepID=A0AAV5GCB3_9BASI|nr:hypothetical protein Rhopal_000248-T1 [Rhodotorula paludigena]